LLAGLLSEATASEASGVDKMHHGGAKLNDLFFYSQIVGETRIEGRLNMETENLQTAKLFAGGDGTEANPYLIETVEQLQNLNSECSQKNYYVLKKDIDLTPYLSENGKGYDNKHGWSPVSLYGSFDGNGHKIFGLWINRPAKHDIGLFSDALERSEIKNLVVEIDNIKGGVKGNEYVGGLVGMMNGKISNCHIIGNVSGSKIVGGLVGASSKKSKISDSDTTGCIMGNCDHVGGLIGQNHGEVSGCYATGSVMGGNDHVGGLVGANMLGIISNSYATGNVSGNQVVGGLVGINSGKISGNYATGNVSGNNIVNMANTAIGGLVGINAGTITDSYAIGSVTGVGGNGRFVGGLVGANMGGQVSNSYAAGKIIGKGDSESIGSLAGVNGDGGKFDNCYCDTQVSGISSEVGKTTAEMKNQSSYDNSWDFEGTWKINPAENNGYPTLRQGE